MFLYIIAHFDPVSQLPAVTCCIEDLDEAVVRLSEKRDMAEQALRATFSSLRELLDARERDLLASLADKTAEKQKMLGNFANNILY